jgi:hypothetical protein
MLIGLKGEQATAGNVYCEIAETDICGAYECDGEWIALLPGQMPPADAAVFWGTPDELRRYKRHKSYPDDDRIGCLIVSVPRYAYREHVRIATYTQSPVWLSNSAVELSVLLGESRRLFIAPRRLVKDIESCVDGKLRVSDYDDDHACVIVARPPQNTTRTKPRADLVRRADGHLSKGDLESWCDVLTDYVHKVVGDPGPMSLTSRYSGFTIADRWRHLEQLAAFLLRVSAAHRRIILKENVRLSRFRFRWSSLYAFRIAATKARRKRLQQIKNSWDSRYNCHVAAIARIRRDIQVDATGECLSAAALQNKDNDSGYGYIAYPQAEYDYGRWSDDGGRTVDPPTLRVYAKRQNSVLTDEETLWKCVRWIYNEIKPKLSAEDESPLVALRRHKKEIKNAIKRRDVERRRAARLRRQMRKRAEAAAGKTKRPRPVADQNV